LLKCNQEAFAWIEGADSVRNPRIVFRVPAWDDSFLETVVFDAKT